MSAPSGGSIRRRERGRRSESGEQGRGAGLTPPTWGSESNAGGGPQRCAARTGQGSDAVVRRRGEFFEVGSWRRGVQRGRRAGRTKKRGGFGGVGRDATGTARWLCGVAWRESRVERREERETDAKVGWTGEMQAGQH